MEKKKSTFTRELWIGVLGIIAILTIESVFNNFKRSIVNFIFELLLKKYIDFIYFYLIVIIRRVETVDKYLTHVFFTLFIIAYLLYK